MQIEIFKVIYPHLYLLVLVGFLSGCGSSKLYLDVSEVQPDTVELHLKRESRLVGSGNSIMVIDSGEGAEYNAVMLSTNDRAIYIGPNESQKIAYGKNPIIGKFPNLCGIEKDKLKKLLINSELNSFEDANTCISSFGKYSYLNDGSVSTLLKIAGGAQAKAIADLQPEILETLLQFEDVSSRFTVYHYRPVSAVGEIESGDSFEWSRPPGELEIYGFLGCLGSCGGESGGIMFPPQPPLTLLPGREYYILLDIGGYVVSDQPIK